MKLLARICRLVRHEDFIDQLEAAEDPAAIIDVIESVDSLRLARRLSVMTERSERSDLEILVQVNTSGEEAKSGFGAAQAVDAVAEIRSLPGLRVAGLMTMAPFTTDRAWLRSTFQAARELFEECGTRIDGFSPQVLSMGMSNDFELAVGDEALERVIEAAGGRVWSGTAAREQGLLDAHGGPLEAIREALRRAELPEEAPYSLAVAPRLPRFGSVRDWVRVLPQS